MKTLLLPALCLFALSAAAQMQTPPPTKAELAAKDIAEGKEMPEPFKGASIILIHTTDSAGVAYSKIARALLAANFALGKTDKELGAVSTVPKPGKSGVAVTVNASVMPQASGSVIRLQGTSTCAAAELIARGGGQQLATVSYGGMQGSPKREAWDLVAQAATAYGSGRITYARQH